MSSPIGLAFATLAACALGLAGLRQGPTAANGAGGWKLEAPKPVPDERPLVNELWREITCSGCHEDVAREWSKTTHATAWMDPRYQEELKDKRKPEACHNCHIPEPLSKFEPGVKPNARDAQQPSAHLGVDCAACHAGTHGDILGPVGAKTKVHSSTRSTAFLPEGKSQLCIACHATNVGPVIGVAKDFAASNQAEQQKSCVGCHMQAIEREFVSAPEKHAEWGDPPYPKRAGRSHELQTPRDPAFLARAFEISARQEPERVVVKLHNACGHRVPGLIGRTLELEAELLDASGKRVDQAALVLDHTNFLPVDEDLPLDLAGRGVKVRLRGLHEAPGFAKKVLFLELELDVQR